MPRRRETDNDVIAEKKMALRQAGSIVNRFGLLGIVLIAIAVAVVAGQVYLTNELPRPNQLEPLKQQNGNGERHEAKRVLIQEALPHQVAHGGFTGSTACRDCHREQFDSWHGSYHRTMTQVATPETVVAPFDRVRLSSRGRDYLFTREADAFYVTMVDPDWEAGAIAKRHELVLGWRILVPAFSTVTLAVGSSFSPPRTYSPKLTFDLVSTEISKVVDSFFASLRAASRFSKMGVVFSVFFNGFSF